MPAIANPFAMAAHKALEASALGDKAALFREGLLDLIPMATVLKDIIPQDTLLWKLDLLAQGNRLIRPLYRQARPAAPPTLPVCAA